MDGLRVRDEGCSDLFEDDQVGVVGCGDWRDGSCWCGVPAMDPGVPGELFAGCAASDSVVVALADEAGDELGRAGYDA